MLGTVFSAIAVFFLVWLIYWFYKVWHMEKYLKTIPAHRLVPLLGNVWLLAWRSDFLAECFSFYETFKGNFKVYIGAHPLVVICEPRDVEFLLKSTKITKRANFVYEHIRKVFGDGLITGGGEKWKQHRKILTPAFHLEILDNIINVFNSNSRDVIKVLSAKAEKESFDIEPIISRCIFLNICEFVMGEPINIQNNFISEYAEALSGAERIFMKRSFSIILSNEFLYRFTKSYQEERDVLKTLYGFAWRLLEEKKKKFVRAFPPNGPDKMNTSTRIRKRGAFTDLMMQDSTFSEQDMLEEISAIFVSGSDTTSMAISCALFSLAMNPDIQEKVYAELQTIFGDDTNRDATLKDLQEMTYLEMVIKETLRYYTIIPFIGRILDEDTNMNGVLLPKGLEIIIAICCLHSSDLLYEEPKKFNPERFNTANSSKNLRNYIPFGVGHQNCIGQKFAMLEMKELLSNILRHFQILPAVPAHKLELRAYVVLKCENGIVVRIKPRN